MPYHPISSSSLKPIHMTLEALHPAILPLQFKKNFTSWQVEASTQPLCHIILSLDLVSYLYGCVWKPSTLPSCHCNFEKKLYKLAGGSLHLTTLPYHPVPCFSLNTMTLFGSPPPCHPAIVILKKPAGLNHTLPSAHRDIYI